MFPRTVPSRIGPSLLGLLAACASTPSGEVPGINRDLHGPPDVDAYIERLQSEARVRELEPDKVVASLELARDARIADIGCGPGVFAAPLARACPEGVVYAADVEPAQLDALRELLRAEELENVIPVLASYGDPHLPPGRIDLLFVSDTYHHVDERVEYFRRLHTDLAPGGRLAVIEYKDGDLPVGPPADHKVPKSERHRELRDAGWRLAEVHTFHTWHDFEVWRPAGDAVQR